MNRRLYLTIFLVLFFCFLSREANAAITSDLYFGYTGPQVTEAQQVLVKLGLLNVTPTGTYGPKTKSAVLQLQKTHDIRQTGSIGPLTRALLQKLLSNNQFIATSTATSTPKKKIIPSYQQIELTAPTPKTNLPAGNSNPSTNPYSSVAAGTLNVMYPIGGETFYIGHTYQIKWSSNLKDDDNVSIYLLQGNSSSLLIATNVLANLHSFAWTVPEIEEAGNLKIQIKSSSGVTVTSPANFSVLEDQPAPDPNLDGQG